MKNLFFNRPGKIIEGDMKGWYVLFQDEEDLQGSYLILFSKSLDLKDTEGYDNWVENLEDLKAYIKEANWKIEWLDPKKASLFYKSEN